MYIEKREAGYMLTEKLSENAYCEVLAPVIMTDGVEKRGKIIASGDAEQTSVAEGMTIKDKIENLGDGIFKVTRSVKNDNSHSIRFKSIFEANTVFKPNHFLFA